jgi:hypothetical protein
MRRTKSSSWVPDDIPEAVRLLRWDGTKPPPLLIKSVVAGLRAIVKAELRQLGVE